MSIALFLFNICARRGLTFVLDKLLLLLVELIEDGGIDDVGGFGLESGGGVRSHLDQAGQVGPDPRAQSAEKAALALLLFGLFIYFLCTQGHV